MADKGVSIKVTKGQHVLDNLTVINKNMNKILGRVVDPPLKKYMRSYMQTTSGMKKYPGPSITPRDWETPKQKRWYFWKFGDNPEYSRTGAFFRAFDVLVSRRDLWTSITNIAEMAKYLMGDRQQRAHKAAGWRKMETYEPDALRGAVPVATNALESEVFRFLTTKGLV